SPVDAAASASVAALPVPPPPKSKPRGTAQESNPTGTSVGTPGKEAEEPATPKEKAAAAVVATKEEPKKKEAAVSTLAPEDIQGFEGYPAPMQKLITEALELTKMNLRYQFGSSDPKSGGMDCSGTIYYLLHKLGVSTLPRQADEVCGWSMKQSILYRTEHVGSLKDSAFSALKPGDLLFWTGTYETATPRSIPVTHVMIYLGKRKENGKPVIFGASDGRAFDGEKRNGVSVFDFPIPKAGSKAEFYGYAPLPREAWDVIRKG
ncbi:MAG: C40 family peptidase, partial [Verrucomicrobium sp.]